MQKMPAKTPRPYPCYRWLDFIAARAIPYLGGLVLDTGTTIREEGEGQSLAPDPLYMHAATCPAWPYAL